MSRYYITESSSPVDNISLSLTPNPVYIDAPSYVAALEAVKCLNFEIYSFELDSLFTEDYDRPDVYRLFVFLSVNIPTFYEVAKPQELNLHDPNYTVGWVPSYGYVLPNKKKRYIIKPWNQKDNTPYLGRCWDFAGIRNYCWRSYREEEDAKFLASQLNKCNCSYKPFIVTKIKV